MSNPKVQRFEHMTHCCPPILLYQHCDTFIILYFQPFSALTQKHCSLLGGEKVTEEDNYQILHI